MQVQEFGHRGIRCMAVARTDAQGQWQMLGLLTFLDPPRPDTRSTLETALRHGVQTRMVRDRRPLQFYLNLNPFFA